jgi:hypothetical protein
VSAVNGWKGEAGQGQGKDDGKGRGRVEPPA